MQKVLTIIGIGLAVLIGIGVIIAAVIYFWPFTDKKLQQSPIEKISYDKAVAAFQVLNQAEASEGVTEDCRSKLLDHGKKTEKVVVMFHGVTACSKQFDGLAKEFHARGYTVLMPRAPHHGLVDGREHGKVTADELVAYVTKSMNIATNVGEELGVVGLSGGGLLATWAAEYRTDVRRLLVLSPFYEPAADRAPKWQLPFLYFLYGKHILPDHFIEPTTPGDAAFSYAALANYGILARNLKPNGEAQSLKSVAVVTSEADNQIDLFLADSIPKKIAETNKLSFQHKILPQEWNIIHDIVNSHDERVQKYQAYLFKLYVDLYEGTLRSD